MVLAAAYVIMALGLNVVVGFAGLLDLGYVAFFAIGAHVTAYFGSAFWANADVSLLVGDAGLPGIHFNFLLILVLAVARDDDRGRADRACRRCACAATTSASSRSRSARSSGRSSPTAGRSSFFGGTLTGGPQGITAIDRIDLPFVEPLRRARPAPVVLVRARAGRAHADRQLPAARLAAGPRVDRAARGRGAAASAGVPIVRTKLLAYGVGAALGGVSGAFLASYLSTVNPHQFTFSFSIFILAMVVRRRAGLDLGRRRRRDRPVGDQQLPAAASSTTSPARWACDFDLSQIASGIYGFLLVIVMLLRPKGSFRIAAAEGDLQVVHPVAGVSAS